MRKRILRARETGLQLIGIFVAQLVEREAQCGGKFQGLFDRLGRVPKQLRHLGGRLEVTLGIDGEAPAGLIERQMLADAGEHMLQLPAVGVMIGGSRRARRAVGSDDDDVPSAEITQVTLNLGELRLSRTAGSVRVAGIPSARPSP